MRVYIPNTSKQSVGGGWTWLRNFKKSMKMHDVQFVEKWEDCDILLIAGVTITTPSEVHEAKRAGKGIVFRVDNVPKKSRNTRNTPHERMVLFANLADVIIYQSKWAEDYCKPLTGEGTIIYNGVDTDIFYPNKEHDRFERYLFAYHGKSELKGFWQAHAIYQQEHIKNGGNCDFRFIYDFKSDELKELIPAKYDFWNDETYTHLAKVDTPEQMAEIMRDCTHLICPSVADAAPNIVLEARACGLEVIGAPPKEHSGVQEMIDLQDITLERMGEEYYGVMSVIMQELAQ